MLPEHCAMTTYWVISRAQSYYQNVLVNEANLKSFECFKERDVDTNTSPQ